MALTISGTAPWRIGYFMRGSLKPVRKAAGSTAASSRLNAFTDSPFDEAKEDADAEDHEESST